MSGADLPASVAAAKPAGAPGEEPPRGALARVAERFTAWAERWIPDAFVFALAATLIVVGAAGRSATR